MANSTGNQGGSHDQHAKAGQQSHKNTEATSQTPPKKDAAEKSSKTSGTGTQGGTHEQHVKAGQQSHKNS